MITWVDYVGNHWKPHCHESSSCLLRTVYLIDRHLQDLELDCYLSQNGSISEPIHNDYYL